MITTRLKFLLLLTVCSSLLFSCNFVTKAYKETFEIQEDTLEIQEDTLESGSKEDEPAAEQTEESKSSAAPVPDVPEVKEVNLLEDAEKLDAIQAELQEMFPGKSLMIYPPHIYFESDRIRLQLVDPNIPENIDWYYYETETANWRKEDPVKTNAYSKRDPIPFNTVKFGIANDIYQQLQEKTATVEGAEVPTTVYFTFNLPKWNWNARITGSRSDYDFKADKDGNEIEFKRN